jgi:hypothetical protein
MSEKRRPTIRLRAQFGRKRICVELFPLAEFLGKVPKGESPNSGTGDRYRLRVNRRWFETSRRVEVYEDDVRDSERETAEPAGEDGDGRALVRVTRSTTWQFFTLSEVFAVMRRSLADWRKRAGRQARIEPQARKKTRASPVPEASGSDHPGSQEDHPGSRIGSGDDVAQHQKRQAGARAQALLAGWSRGDDIATQEDVESEAGNVASRV